MCTGIAPSLEPLVQLERGPPVLPLILLLWKQRLLVPVPLFLLQEQRLQVQPFQVPEGWLGDSAGRGRMAFFGWGQSGGTGGMGYSPLQEPVETLCLCSYHCQLNHL